MKAKIDKKEGFKREYYFHPDEDFREDRDWGKKNKSAEPLRSHSQKKSSDKRVTKG